MWAIVVIVVVAVLIATGFLVYGYFWTPNESQQQVELKDETADWKTYSRNGNTFTFNYPSRVCNDNNCYNLWIVELNKAVIVGQDRESGIIEPIFEINYENDIDQNSAEKYIESVYDKCKIKSWKSKGEIYVLDFVAPCGRIFAAYSKNSNALVAFDLNQMACIFDCKTDEKFIQSIRLDGFVLKNTYE